MQNVKNKFPGILQIQNLNDENTLSQIFKLFIFLNFQSKHDIF